MMRNKSDWKYRVNNECWKINLIKHCMTTKSLLKELKQIIKLKHYPWIAINNELRISPHWSTIHVIMKHDMNLIYCLKHFDIVI